MAMLHHPDRHAAARLAAVLAASATVSGQTAGPDLRTCQDKTRTCSIAIPAAWTEVGAEQGSVDDLDEAVISVRSRPPGWDDLVAVDVSAARGVAINQAAYVRGEHAAMRAAKGRHHRLEFNEAPIPHVLTDFGISSLHLRTSCFVRMRGYGFRVDLSCARSDLPRLHPVLPGIVGSLQYTGPVWPPRVREDRTETMVDGIVLSVRGAGADAVKRLERCIRTVQREFVELHGPVSRPAGEELVVYLNANRERHGDIFSRTMRHAVEWAAHERRIVTVPIPAGDSELRDSFVRVLVAVLLHERYGTAEPAWFKDGVCFIVAFREETGRRLPSVPRWFHDLLGAFRKPLAEVPGLPIRAGTTFHDAYLVHAVGYVALFQGGKARYREAWRSFLAELGRSADGDAAAKDHLYSLDQEELLQDARSLLKRLRPIERK